jgi:hypothetical protein
VVALTTIGVTVWLTTRRFSHERQLTDLAELRAVLDDAAIALHQASYARAELFEAFQGGKTGFPQFPEGRANSVATAERLDALIERLTLRLGETDSTTAALSRSAEAFSKMLGATSHREGAPPDTVDLPQREEALECGSGEFEVAWQEFRAAASAAVAVQLPSKGFLAARQSATSAAGPGKQRI